MPFGIDDLSLARYNFSNCRPALFWISLPAFPFKNKQFDVDNLFWSVTEDYLVEDFTF